MSKIDDLIKQFCPRGIEFKELGEIGTLYGGLSGKSKSDFTDGNARFITYVSIFNNITIDTSNTGWVKVGESERQTQVKMGDVLFTGSSETPDDCGMSSVLTTETSEALYLNSFCFGFRPNDSSTLLPDFTKYLFRDSEIRKQIVKSASGVTRFNISKKRFIKIRIPIPPVEVQKEIALILDKFTSLEAELEAELEARRKQYEFYRNQLLSFDELGGARWTTMGEIGELIRGNGLQKKDFTEEGVQAVHYGQIYTYYGTFADKTKSFVSPELAKKLKKAQRGDVLISGVSENIEDVCKPLGWLGDEVCISGDMFAFRHNQNPKYITYLLQTLDFQRYKERNAQGTKVIRVKADKILQYKIPMPPLDEQKRVVSILDKFESLVNSISEGLPAEIKGRRKQYEHYRNKLLTFQEMTA